MKKRTAIIATLAAIAPVTLAILLLRGIDPAQTRWFPDCMLYRLTGLYCAGCGITRALHRLFNGDAAGAMRLNPLIVPAAVAAMLLLLRPKWFGKKWVLISMAATVVLFTVLRNLPWEPFAMLAPHD
ncbi:MAG: DUF2752 domain-containing protein [Victivallaceae bacterium]|nr:DUF2752 domain-containing protein [Victivallaceae bacterium]